VLPPLNEKGYLPPGVHPTSWEELGLRFGKETTERVRALAQLRHLHELAARTGRLGRFLIFGSFISKLERPRDVDVILIMQPDFVLEDAPRECQTLFSHPDAEARFGASVFWLRDGMLPPDLMSDFMDTWQTSRDGEKRGIVEIKL
jgi:hypothetical protein